MCPQDLSSVDAGTNLCAGPGIEETHTQEDNFMAAFCTCCGAAITSKSERCAVCGAASHGTIGASPLHADAVPAARVHPGTGCKHLPADKAHLTAWK